MNKLEILILKIQSGPLLKILLNKRNIKLNSRYTYYIKLKITFNNIIMDKDEIAIGILINSHYIEYFQLLSHGFGGKNSIYTHL